MNKRIFLFGIIIAAILASIGIGFAVWGIASQLSGEAEGEFKGYTIIDLDNVTNDVPVYYYSEYGFYNETTNEYSFNTTFSAECIVSQKEEPYNLSVTLIDQDNFLSSASIDSIATIEENNIVTSIASGTNSIIIENITTDMSFIITYTISTNDSDTYELIYSNLSTKSIYMRITAATDDGTWTIDKTITLIKTYQDPIPVAIPSGRTVTYNGENQNCVVQNSAYQRIDNNTQKNAGTYNVRIYLKPGYKWSDNTTNYKQVTFIINPLLVNLQSYDNQYTTAVAYNTLKSTIFVFKDSSNNIWSPIIGKSCIYDNKFKIGDYSDFSSYTSTYDAYDGSVVPGSAYTMRCTLSDNNFTLGISTATATLRSVEINGTFYTLQEALSVNNTTNTKIVKTYTTMTQNGTLASSNKMLIPYSTTYTINASSDKFPYANTEANGNTSAITPYSEQVYSELIIAKGVTLTVNGILVVGGKFSGNQPIGGGTYGPHGNIRLFASNSVIDGQNNSIISTYGYIYGLGKLDIRSGCKTYAPFVIYDYHGGTYCAVVYNTNNCAPFNGYALVNVQCNATFYYGANLYGYATLYADNKQNQSSALVLATSGALMNLTSGYINFSYNATKKVAVTVDKNVYNFGLTTYEAYGDLTLNSISMNVGISISTEDVVMPIPANFKFIQKSGTFKINNKYAIFPGSEIIIDYGANILVSGTLLVCDGFKPVVYSASYAYGYGSSLNDFSKRGHLIVNGSMNINGTFSGLIETNGTGVISTGSSSNFTTTYIDGVVSGEDYLWVYKATTTNKTSYNLIGQIYDYLGNKITLQRSKTYYGLTDSENSINSFTCYDYKTSQNVTTTFSSVEKVYGSYVDNLNIEIKYINTLNNSVIITNSKVLTNASTNNYHYNITSGDLNISTLYFDINGYYYDSQMLDNDEVNIGDTIYSSINIYCDTMPKDFNINYVSGGYSLSTTHNTFNALSNFNLDVPTKTDETFIGWYTSSDFSGTAISNINSANFESLYSLLNNGQLNLYAKFVSGTTYRLSFVDDDATISNKPSGYNLPSTQNIIESDLPYVINSDTTYLNNDLEEYYIVSYIINGTEYTSYSLTSSDFTNGEIEISVKYGRKLTIIYQITSANKFTRYQLSGLNLQSPGSVDTANTYSGNYYWYDGSSMLNVNASVSANKTVTLYTRYSVNTSNGEYGAQVKRTISVSGYYATNTSSVPVSKNSEAIMTNSTSATTFYMYSAFNNTAQINSISMSCNDGYESPVCSQAAPLNVTANITLSFSSKKKTSCLIEGTMISMYDGSKKLIEELEFGDLVVVFNHITGQNDVMPVIFVNHKDSWGYDYYDVLRLHFSDNSELGIVSSHGLFDYTLMQYIYVDYDNYQELIGHEFYTDHGLVTLVSGEVNNEYIRVFSPVSYFHMNMYANGLLTSPPIEIPDRITGLVNYFEYDDDLKYNEEKMQQDLETYGMYTYDDFKEYGLTEEAFNSSPSIHLKVAVGKGMLTKQDIVRIIYYLLNLDLIDGDTNENK